MALSRFCCNAYSHPLRVAAVGSARYCIIFQIWLDTIQVGAFFCLMFSWFEHPLRKSLKAMEKNARQPRLKNITSKQVSALTLRFAVTGMELFPKRLTAVQSYKGVQHFFERSIELFSKRITAVQSSVQEVKELWKDDRITTKWNPLSIVIPF